MKMNRNKGRELNISWNVNAEHALYSEDGKWYHHLKRFPGALFDKDGYIIFNNKYEYEDCKYLQHGKELHVPEGIKDIQGYVLVNI